MTDLADTLELLREGGAAAFYTRRARPRADRGHVRERGGAITDARTSPRTASIRRRPIGADFRGHEFVSNPPPSSGGVLIALRPAPARPARARRPGRGAPTRSRALVEVMREQARVRGGTASRATLYRGGLARAALRRDAIEAALARIARRSRRASRGARRRAARRTSRSSTRDGNAASLTVVDRLRLGRDRPGHRHPPEQHARRVRPQPGGRAPRPGARLTSMMAPSIVLARRPAAARRRQRGLAAAARRDPPDRRQRRRPRPARRGGDRRRRASTSRTAHVHCEGGADPAELDELERARLRRRPLAPAQPLLRRRRGRRGAAGRDARRRRRPAARRRTGSSSVS